MSPTRALARFAAGLRLEATPVPVIDAAKALLLDTLGTALAAGTLGAGCREAIAVMCAAGGAAQASVIGTTHKLPAAHAAFANGALAHALNFDAIGPEAGHLGVACLAAPLAAAQASGASGRTFLAGVIVAAEVNARVTAAVARVGMHSGGKVLDGQLLAGFGAAAGAGRVFGLNAEQIESALGLALMQAGGSMQIVLGGDPPAKAIYGAFPNQTGVRAAELARAGLDARCAALDGPAGLYALFYGGRYDPAPLTATEFLLLGAQFKPWPTSGIVHPFIEAALDLAPARPIAAVRVAGHSHIAPWCEPVGERRRPTNAAAAANSVPFAVAKALAHGAVTLADFAPAGLADPAAHALADRIECRYDDTIEGGEIEILTAAGARAAAAIRVGLGHPSRPMPRTRLVEKFRDCCRHAPRPVDVDTLIDVIDTLEHQPDLSRLAAAWV